MKRNRMVVVAFATALSAGSVVLGASPATAGGNWFPQPCTGVGTVCTSGTFNPDGTLYTSTDGTLRWNACDNSRYKSQSYDGIIWQNGPGGRTTCTVVRGGNG